MDRSKQRLNYICRRSKERRLVIFFTALAALGLHYNLLALEDIEETNSPRLRGTFVSVRLPWGHGEPELLPLAGMSQSRDSKNDGTITGQRQESVAAAFRWAWNAYRRDAWGEDELMPVSRRSSHS